MTKGGANFTAFLESRAGNTLGCAFLGCVTAAVGWPLFVAWQYPRAFGRVTGNLLTEMAQGEVEFTWAFFLDIEIIAAIIGAGIGAIHGARMGARASGIAGFALGLLVEILAFPLGIYADFAPEGPPLWILVLGIALSVILGMIVGTLRARESQMEYDLSLDQIRKKSRRR